MKTISPLSKIALTFVLFYSSSVLAAFAGTVVVAKGDVKILTKSLKEDSKKKKFVLYEGGKYSYRLAKIGLRLKPGQIVLTGTDGRAKVSYSNGDHVIMAPGSSISMPEPERGKKGNSKIRLFYGKIRALVSKRGPRKKLNVKTKSAVAGVRGTDFYMAYNGASGTEVTVLRGAVAVKDDKSKKEAKVIKTGYSAKVNDTKKAEEKKEAEVKVVEASKDQLLQVQAASNVKLNKKELTSLKKETREMIEKLEKKSLKVVLDDVKDEDPELYKELKSKKNLKESDINTQVVAKLYKQAPAAKKPTKANLEEIDQIGKDVYEKYFKDK